MTASVPADLDPVLRRRLERQRRLARVMDEAVRIPGTGLTIGLDPLIGLLPGVGDLAGSAVSGYVVADAVRSRVPVPVLARMGWNILVDAALGLVPVVGDAADVVHRAHRKNAHLLAETLAAGRAGAQHGRGPDVGYVLAALVLVALPLLVAVVVAVAALVWLLSLVL